MKTLPSTKLLEKAERDLCVASERANRTGDAVALASIASARFKVAMGYLAVEIAERLDGELGKDRQPNG